MANSTQVVTPNVTGKMVQAAIAWLKKQKATFSTSNAYNAYIVSMVLAPGTHAQINALANHIGKAYKNPIIHTANVPMANPILHMGHGGARQYWLKARGNGKGNVAKLSYATLMPQCVVGNNNGKTTQGHGQNWAQCNALCQYGLYVAGKATYAHLLVVQGKGSQSVPNATSSAPSSQQ